MTFHPADPMVLLYNRIDKLKTMAKSADISYTEAQLLDMGLTFKTQEILKKTSEIGKH